MKILLLLAILAPPSLHGAGLEWHEFDISDQRPSEIRSNGAVLTLASREVEGAPFKEDNLEFSFSRDTSKAKKSYWFSSSYGSGAVAIAGNLVFLKYGIGRGTFAREEHVRVYLAGKANDLEEMGDVKVSSYVDLPGSKSINASHVEYKILVKEAKPSVAVTFLPPSVKGVSWPEKTLIISTGK